VSKHLTACSIAINLNDSGVFRGGGTIDPPRIIIIIISGFGIYGAAVVPDSGVGNTWRMTVIFSIIFALLL